MQLMDDFEKTKEQLIAELTVLRQGISRSAATPESKIQQYIDELRNQAKRERMLAQIDFRIRQSLNLQSILDAAVDGVRKLLQVDRVAVCQFVGQANGKIVAESVLPGWTIALGSELCELYFPTGIEPGHASAPPWRWAIADVCKAGLPDFHLKMLERLEVKASLVVPIVLGAGGDGTATQLWGLLIAHQCRSERYWQETEIDLLERLSVQISIAIQHAGAFAHAHAELQERRRAEKELRDALQKLNFHVENSPLIVIEWDSNFQVSRWSGQAERIFGWTAQEMIGRYPHDLRFIHEDNQPEVEQVLNCLREGPQRNISLHRNYSKSGTIIHCEWYNSALLDSAGNLVSVLSLVQDITARVEAEEHRLAAERTRQMELQVAEMQKLSNLKDEFLNTVSHELRTPLANMKLAIHMMEAGITPDKQQRYLQILKGECLRETSLVNDLLDFQRLDADRLPITPERIDLDVLISRILIPFASRADQRQLSLKADIQVTAMLMSDRQCLERILCELVNNACKYTPPGGTIVVGVQQQDAIEISVWNDGSEIPQQEIPHIFETFYRVPGNDQWSQGGTGLGLSLVKKLVTRIGGRIQVESRANETTFTVKLPPSIGA
jgi:PAS domain S-box-containing protein